MGTHDTIYCPCPNCGLEYPCQSKSGECMLAEFSLLSASPLVLEGVNSGAPFICKCGEKFMVDTHTRKTLIARGEKAMLMSRAERIIEGLRVMVDKPGLGVLAEHNELHIVCSGHLSKEEVKRMEQCGWMQERDSETWKLHL